MIPKVRRLRVLGFFMVICLLIVGCAPSVEEALENVSQTQTNAETEPSSKLIDDEDQSNQETVSVQEQPAPKVNPKTEAPNEDVVVADKTKDQNPSTDAKVYQVTEEYDASNPTLMGFTINDSADQVIERFGKPLLESFMSDDSEPLAIYEYPGFIIGFNSTKQIVFIEVNSADVNPGLNQLQIGQTVEEARHSLGTPNSLNEYVMIYSANDLIMKLDIDPNTSIIRSIKLFGE